MFTYTKELNDMFDELKPYLVLDGIHCHAAPDAPEGTEEKYQHLLKLLREREKYEIEMMFA